MEKIKTADYPWVFWLRVSIRRGWFAFRWSTRGANYWEGQLWIFNVSIGRPWLQMVVDSHERDYGSSLHVHKTNKGNLKQPLAFLVKRSPK